MLSHHMVAVVVLLTSSALSSSRLGGFALVHPPSISSGWHPTALVRKSSVTSTYLASYDSGGGGKFYDDFEDFGNIGGDEDDDEDDDDNDDDEIQLDDADIKKFMSQMENQMGDEEEDEDEGDNYSYESEGIGKVEGLDSVDDLIKFATSSIEEVESTEWARPIELSDDLTKLTPGSVLIANPAKFCSDIVDPRSDPSEASKSGGVFSSMLGNGFGGGDTASQPSPALLAKFGLTLPPPEDLGPDRRADLLPVLVVLERHPLRGTAAVLMNRRTGYLLGDLESQSSQDGGFDASAPPRLGAFMIQPLWFGGTSAVGGTSNLDDDGGDSEKSGGLGMLHQCPAVKGAKQLTADGLYWGGDPAQAQDAMDDPSLERPMTGFDFKFYVQCTRWLPMQLEKEIQAGTWFVASASKEVLFKSRDRLGSKRAKPLWTELCELLGDEYRIVRDALYGDLS